MYASAQALYFLARTKNTSFPNRKLLISYPEFPEGHWLVCGSEEQEARSEKKL
jgi:hypothetical protein